MYNKIVRKNPGLSVYPVTDMRFRRYGRVVAEYDFTPWIEAVNTLEIPAEGNVYVADDRQLLSGALRDRVQARLYAGMPIQAGYCNGNGNSLNALEYHKTPELDIAVTDLVLLLADVRDITGNTLDAGAVEAFYLPAGAACELNGTTLHFAPCKVADSGFKSIVVLPEGTNTPLEPVAEPACEEDRLLWMKGKWLIAHRDSVPAAKGAYVGIRGENIRVNY